MASDELLRELAGLNSPYKPVNPSSIAFQQRIAQLGSQSGTGLGNAGVARSALTELAQGPAIAQSGFPSAVAQPGVGQQMLFGGGGAAPRIASTAEQLAFPNVGSTAVSGIGAMEGAASPGLFARGMGAVGGLGGLTRGIGIGLAGQAAGGAIEKFGVDQGDPTGLRSNTARVLGETTKYGALGAGFGGPLGGLIGGTGGALIGGVKNMFALNKNPHEAENKQNNYIQGLIDASTEDKKERAQIANKYTTLMVLAKTPEEKAAIGQKFATDLTAQIGGGPGSGPSQEDLNKQAIAAQVAAQNFIKPITTQMHNSAQQQADLINQLGGQLPPEYRGLAQQHAADQVTGADRMAAAYAMQLQSMPQIEAMRQQQQMVNQIAQQQYAKMLSGQATSGGGGDLQSQIAAQLGG